MQCTSVGGVRREQREAVLLVGVFSRQCRVSCRTALRGTQGRVSLLGLC